MTILLATDLSARATLAGDVAARLARATHERLVVLHVAERHGDAEALEHEVARLEQTTDAELVLRLGEVVPTIIRYATETAPRYVVVGAQGRSARVVLGTVATALAARLSVALFVVRAGERLLPFLDGKRFLHVVLPHALDDTFVGARDALVELSRIAPIDAIVVHAPGARGAPTAEARAAIERELSTSIGKVPGVDVRVELREGPTDSAQRILDVISETTPDLVICGTHQRRGVARLVEGSVASFLALMAPCTVLVAPTMTVE